MTESTSPQPGTAVAKRADDHYEEQLLALAKTPEEKAVAYRALAAVRQSKLIRQAATAIANETWGKAVSEHARAAIARYALETGTDPVRHWTVLGTTLYDTAQLWLDLATSQPDYAGVEVDQLTYGLSAEFDKELGAEELQRRRQARVQHGLPLDAKGACVVRVYRRGVERPFVGANHAGNRKTYVAKDLKEGTKLDPVGEQDPAKTAYTRAFRRAAKIAWPIWPYRQRAVEADEGYAIDELPPGTVERMEGRDHVEEILEQGKAARQAGAAPDAGTHGPFADPDAPARQEEMELER